VQAMDSAPNADGRADNDRGGVSVHFSCAEAVHFSDEAVVALRDLNDERPILSMRLTSALLLDDDLRLLLTDLGEL